MLELTVFVSVNIDIDKESWKLIPWKLIIEESIRSKIIKNKKDKKHLLTSSDVIFKFEKNKLVLNMYFGLATKKSSLKENFINNINFINLIPELVEKKPPPIIVRNKKNIDKLFGLLFKLIPILEMLETNDKNKNR